MAATEHDVRGVQKQKGAKEHGDVFLQPPPTATVSLSDLKSGPQLQPLKVELLPKPEASIAEKKQAVLGPLLQALSIPPNTAIPEQLQRTIFTRAFFSSLEFWASKEPNNYQQIISKTAILLEYAWLWKGRDVGYNVNGSDHQACTEVLKQDNHVQALIAKQAIEKTGINGIKSNIEHLSTEFLINFLFKKGNCQELLGWLESEKITEAKVHANFTKTLMQKFYETGFLYKLEISANNDETIEQLIVLIKYAKVLSGRAFAYGVLGEEKISTEELLKQTLEKLEEVLRRDTIFQENVFTKKKEAMPEDSLVRMDNTQSSVDKKTSNAGEAKTKKEKQLDYIENNLNCFSSELFVAFVNARDLNEIVKALKAAKEKQLEILQDWETKVKQRIASLKSLKTEELKRIAAEETWSSYLWNKTKKSVDIVVALGKVAYQLSPIKLGSEFLPWYFFVKPVRKDNEVQPKSVALKIAAGGAGILGCYLLGPWVAGTAAVGIVTISYFKSRQNLPDALEVTGGALGAYYGIALGGYTMVRSIGLNAVTLNLISKRRAAPQVDLVPATVTLPKIADTHNSLIMYGTNFAWTALEAAYVRWLQPLVFIQWGMPFLYLQWYHPIFIEIGVTLGSIAATKLLRWFIPGLRRTPGMRWTQKEEDDLRFLAFQLNLCIGPVIRKFTIDIGETLNGIWTREETRMRFIEFLKTQEFRSHLRITSPSIVKSPSLWSSPVSVDFEWQDERGIFNQNTCLINIEPPSLVSSIDNTVECTWSPVLPLRITADAPPSASSGLWFSPKSIAYVNERPETRVLSYPACAANERAESIIDNLSVETNVTRTCRVKTA